MQFSTKIALSLILLVVVTTGVLLGILEFEKQNLRASLSTELKEQIRIRTSEILQPVYKLCAVKEAQTIPLLQQDLKNASHALAHRGGMSLVADLVPWEIEADGASRVVELPMMLIGEEWLGKNATLDSPSPIVDEIHKLSGVHCSILQRMNKAGDMVDVCTSKETADHRRAIGTFVPHLNADGSPSKLIEDILAGRQYQERGSYANDWTTCMCEPIRSAVTGEVIGALCASLSQKDTVASIRKIILKTAIGKSGYMWVLGTKGERRGVYIISKDGSRDGENLWNFRDDDGKYFVQSIVQKALETHDGEAQFQRYPWKNPGDKQPRMKISAFTYFAPWDWIIGSSAYEDDFQGPQLRVDRTLQHMIYLTFLTGLALICCSVLVGYHVRKNIRSFTEERERQNWLKTSLNELSEQIRGEQEVGQLLHSILENLAASLAVQVGVIYLREGSDQLIAAATYGVAGRADTAPVIAVGEGVVGQAARNKKTIFLKEVQETALMVSTGFGDVLPTNIIAAPLLHEDEVMGVIQLGSLTPLSDIQCTFMEHAAEAIAIAIYTAQSRAEVNELLEKTQKQARELERISRFKSNFMANMSHELRTPLNAILGFSQLMTRDTSLSTEQLNNLNTINRSGEHLLSLINNVLELSKIEAGQLNVHREQFDLHTMVLGLEEMFRLRAAQDNLRLDIEIADDVPQYIEADQGKLRQILINLLGNAVKFTGKGGSITLRLRRSDSVGPAPPEQGSCRQSRSLLPNSCLLIIEVIDTGRGITAEELTKVFHPFYQTATDRAQQGTGLGLSISLGFAQAMGGDLEARSELGKGSVFTLTVPVTVIEAADFRVSRPGGRIVGLEADQPSFRLLVAEDDTASRDLLVKLLEAVGFEVREAVDGRQAVELWQQWQPHLIWMDFKMPVMDGHEATRLIKNAPAGQDTKVIALTASAFEEDRVRILAEGCDDFLRKPFCEEEIFAMLHKHLGVRYVYGQAGERRRHKAGGGMPLEGLGCAVAALPAETLKKLAEATELSDAAMIGELIEEIRTENEQLANVLADLAENFDYDEVLTLIRKGG